MKVRLVGGPFGGQVKNVNDYGRNEIVMRGPKKMNRKQRYECMMMVGRGIPSDFRGLPTVEARYRISMRVHRNGQQIVNMPCMHPDGSLFYEFIEGSKYER